MRVHLCAVRFQRQKLLIPAEVGKPYIQPLAERHTAGFDICTVRQRRIDREQLFPDFLLRFTGYTFLYLLPRSGVKAAAVPCFPIDVLFPVALYDLFSDVSRSGG